MSSLRPLARRDLGRFIAGVNTKLSQVGADDDLLLSRADGTRLPVRDYSPEFTAQRKAAGLKAIPLGKLRHSKISRMRAAGVAADVVAAWHGHTERMTQAVYGTLTWLTIPGLGRPQAADLRLCSIAGQKVCTKLGTRAHR